MTVPLKLFGSAAHGVLEVVVDPEPAHASSTAPTAVIESPDANKRSTKSLREIFPVVNDRTRSLTGSLAISILLIVDMRRTDWAIKPMDISLRLSSVANPPLQTNGSIPA
ncbi:MAG TPA: hypothetical protein VN985_05250, partial [Candidatus Eisenbacteria bacterium]|nr:hypothetical protein [Candidatus Eisenbacteria bacterium]